MESRQESLARGLVRFWIRLLLVSAIVNGVVAMGGAAYLMVVDRPVTALALSGILFWFGVLSLGWVMFMFSAKVSSLGWGDGAATRAQPRFSQVMEQQEARARLAWYAGIAGLMGLLLGFVLPML